jgi:hypothetical protein
MHAASAGMRWKRRTDSAREQAGYDVLLGTDKNIRYQLNLSSRRIVLVILGNAQWPVVRLYLDRIAAAVNAATPGTYCEVDIPLR